MSFIAQSTMVVAGVIGESKFAYDLWSDTVILASRLEAAAEPGQVLVSAETAGRNAVGFAFDGVGDGAASRGGVALPREPACLHGRGICSLVLVVPGAPGPDSGSSPAGDAASAATAASRSASLRRTCVCNEPMQRCSLWGVRR